MRIQKPYYVLALPVLLFALIGYTSAQNPPGFKAYQSGDFATAIKETKPLAEKGDVESQWLLGSSYANAQPPIQDLDEAEKWIRKAAEQGHIGAMVDMAQLNLFYKPTKDEKTAILWYQKAADRGQPEAQFMIGSYHYSGKQGLPRDNVKAYTWWLLSAAQGHSLAKLMLEKSKDKISKEEISKAKQLAKEWKSVKP